jgi:preprotein translocase subunit SecE
VAKVTWPTRKETTLTTVMVFVMVFLASIFFLAVDASLSTLITWILGFGG